MCVFRALPPLSPCVRSGLWHWWWLCHYFALGALAHLQSPSTSSLLRWQTSHTTNASLALLLASLPDASAQMQASFCSVLLCSWWSCIHLPASSPVPPTSELQMSQFSWPNHSEVCSKKQGDSLLLNPSPPLPPSYFSSPPSEQWLWITPQWEGWCFLPCSLKRRQGIAPRLWWSIGLEFGLGRYCFFCVCLSPPPLLSSEVLYLLLHVATFYQFSESSLKWERRTDSLCFAVPVIANRSFLFSEWNLHLPSAPTQSPLPSLSAVITSSALTMTYY